MSYEPYVAPGSYPPQQQLSPYPNGSSYQQQPIPYQEPITYQTPAEDQTAVPTSADYPINEVGPSPQAPPIAAADALGPKFQQIPGDSLAKVSVQDGEDPQFSRVP
jgi:hypothetical protein